MSKSNVPAPQIEEIIIYLLLDKETHSPYKAYFDYEVASKNTGTNYYIQLLPLSTDSDIYTIQNLQGAINKDVNL